VLKYADELGNIEYMMANSGKIDASSRKDMKTQTLSAHFPMLFHPNPKTVMVLGLASGVTAGEALYYPIEQLDVLEISQQVVEASDFFRPWNNDVLSDPRTNLIIQDARAHLQLTKQKYDIIISEPSNPWMAGMATLFTRDFFELVEASLNEDGTFVQFIHSYQMDWRAFSLVGRTFASVFPNSLLVLTEPSGIGKDYLLVGFKDKNGLSLESAKRRLSCVQQSGNVTLSDPRLLYRLLVSEDLQRLFGRQPVNTDSRPRLEFLAPKLIYRSDPMINKAIQSEKWLTPQTTAIVDLVTSDVDARIDFAAYALSVYQPFANMVHLSKTTPSQKEHFYKLVESYCADNPLDYSVIADKQLKAKCRSIQIQTIQDKIELVPDKAASYFYLAGLYDDQGMLDKAIDSYSKALQIRPDSAEAHYNLGVVFIRGRRYDQAIRHFAEALRINTGLAKAHYNMGLALTRQGRLDEAVTHYIEALRINPHNVDAHYNLGGLFMQQGKPEKAIVHYTEALQITPNSADLHNNLGYALALQGKLAEAVQHYTEALQIEHNLANTHNNLGSVLVRQGKLDEAIKHFTEALRINPNFPDARRNLNDALDRRKKRTVE
jgi:spermidine synthase